MTAEQERDALRKFAQRMFRDTWPHNDVDGGDLQDAAIECGLLAPLEVTEPCGEYCNCADYGDFPQTCYRKTELLTGAKS